MPLVKEDLRQIEELFEELLTKKIAPSAPFSKESQSASSSLSDREVFERILNVELELKNQRDLIEKILHQIEKRFEQVDKRFEQVDKRFEELREDMNRRFEQVDKRFEQVDKRFEELREDMNRRFEQVDKRFGQLFWFIGLFIPLSNSLLFLALSYVLK